MALRRMMKAFASPLSATPGRARWQAWLPEISACCIYILFLAAAILRLINDKSHPFVKPAILAYGLALPVLILAPVVEAAASFSLERVRDTSEALILTPGDHRFLAAARYLRVTLRWARFLVWLVPLYLIMSASGAAKYAGGSGGPKWVLWATGLGLGAKGWVAFLLIMGLERSVKFTLGGLGVMCLRWLTDLVSVGTATAVAFVLSVRVRNAGWALLAAAAITPLLLGTLLALPDHLLLVLAVLADVVRVFRVSAATAGWIFLAAKTVLGPVGLLAVGWLLYRTCAHFDHYALGEKPGR